MTVVHKACKLCGRQPLVYGAYGTYRIEHNCGGMTFVGSPEDWYGNHQPRPIESVILDRQKEEFIKLYGYPSYVNFDPNSGNWYVMETGANERNIRESRVNEQWEEFKFIWNLGANHILEIKK